MQIDLLPIIIGIITLVSSIAITLYAKDYLQKKKEYQKLRKKLEKIAGKHATILYQGTGLGGYQLFKITDIDENGVTIANDLQTVFIPAAKLLQSEMVLPCDNYDRARMAKIKKDMEDFADVLLPAMFDKMFPVMKEAFETHFADEIFGEGEISMVIGMKIAKVLKDEGIIKELPDDVKKRLKAAEEKKTGK